MTLLIFSLPFFSSLSILLFGRFLGQKGTVFISLISIITSMLLSIKILYENMLYNNEIYIKIFEWINTGIMKISLQLYFDKYSIFMVFLITTISSIVITYSTWYMYEDAHKNRFLSYLLMFTVTMLILVSSYNFFFMFIGWETVGIMSYFLINFWYFAINSNKSALKAVFYNKIGDIGIIISMSILILLYENVNINTLDYINTNNNLITFLLFFFILASIAKSAQIVLHCWLGDAMAGPTPVSALLHAATMVTAGVFLLFRLENILYLSSIARYLIIFVGLFTIIFGGLSSINQNDIKKLIAFSTCSQLGYMFLTNGLLIPSVGLFHLLTHGFFKALLFLTAGILIHNFHHEQDLRKFGSFVFSYPLSYIFFFLGSLSILSFPFFSGFYSKEAIIEASLAPQYPLFIYLFMVIGALFTSIYSFKLLYFSFFSYSNSPSLSYISSLNNKYGEIPIFYIPFFLILLFGSLFLGYLFKDFFLISLLNTDLEFIPFYIKLIPLFFSFSGIILAFLSLNPWKYKYILSIFNRRFFFDSINNYFFAYFSLFVGYNYTFKLLDRGFFEFFGPVGLIRILFSLPLFYTTKENKNESSLILYLFLTFSSLFLLFLF